MFDKLQARLTNWKSRTLSTAGRVTLVQSVSTAIPIHVMQSSWLPENVCDKLDKINRDFTWSNDPNAKKLHLVGWQKVTREKKDGGLGIRTARLNNEALLSKMCWKILRDRECVWSKLVQAKYLRKSRFLDYIAKPGDSATWKGVICCMALIKPFIRWKIGDGLGIFFWRDNWLGSGNLCDAVSNINPEEWNLKLADVIDEFRNWRLDELQTQIPETWRKKVLEFPAVLSEASDMILWSETSNGNFTCQSAYKALQKEYAKRQPSAKHLAWVWKLDCGNKLKHFIWLANQNRLATNYLRKVRKISDSSDCNRCEGQEETVIHILRYCGLAKKVWSKLLLNASWDACENIQDEFWLKKNLQFKGRICNNMESMPWNLIFAAGIWMIWKARNEFIFRGKRVPTDVILGQIKQLSSDLWMARRKYKQKTPSVSWIKPKPNWLKLNVDGRVLIQQNTGAIGGVLRDEKGAWLWGFVQKLQCPTVLESEVEAIRVGLTLAWEKRIHQLEVETDSQEAFNIISDDSVRGHELQQKIEECRSLLRMPWNIEFRWIPRAGNNLADAVVKGICDIDGGISFMLTPPPYVLASLAADSA